MWHTPSTIIQKYIPPCQHFPVLLLVFFFVSVRNVAFEMLSCFQPRPTLCLFIGAYGSLSESTRRRVTAACTPKNHLIWFPFQKLHWSLASASVQERSSLIQPSDTAFLCKHNVKCRGAKSIFFSSKSSNTAAYKKLCCTWHSLNSKCSFKVLNMQNGVVKNNIYCITGL